MLKLKSMEIVAGHLLLYAGSDSYSRIQIVEEKEKF